MVTPRAVSGPSFRGMAQTHYHGQFLPHSVNGQVRQTEGQGTEMWKSCDNSKQKDSGKANSQLHGDICNIWTEARGKEKQKHLQDREKISLFSASIKPAVTCPGTDCTITF